MNIQCIIIVETKSKMPIVAIRQYSIIPHGENNVPYLDTQKWMHEFGGDLGQDPNRFSRFQDLGFPAFYVKQPHCRNQTMETKVLPPSDHFFQESDFDRLFELVSESKSPNKKRNSSTKKNDKNKQNHKTSKKRV